MTTDADLVGFMRAVASADDATAERMLTATPELATSASQVEFFLEERLLQIYRGDSALHVAAASYDAAFAKRLVAAGADPSSANDNGSRAFTLTEHTTGRGGTGSPEAKAEQEKIIRLLGSR